ncbi:thioredoxin-dependent hydroperoxide peroxidase [Natronococcus amylolyticus DSM 10524]|uniref:Thioredoxin-dependent hydroperoxide peroxidase n=1 Tax=Natronococcus amylolyticus DSM 10524 TaxID=1227497 RepID=L9WWP5_9EURY|nr:redoxin domain-containing protein [Natronococcus amylolyticus]ELY53591.1 thioredoxin-dependent hydroperoxide peroxidase [Natronococcus amylolyticus DSM 10524]
MSSESLRTTLSNVTTGPKRVSIADLGATSDWVVLLLMQGPNSGTCRQQAREVAAEYDRFERRNATVAAIVPGSAPKVRSWRRLVDPPFPILADRDGILGEEFFQRTRYGQLGRFLPSIGRLPTAVVLDYRDSEPVLEYSYEGETSFDRPSVDELLDAIDACRL